MNRKILLLPLVAVVVFVSSCRKDIIDTDGSLKLTFSTDTLTFDTVFTTLSSTTLSFKVYNPNKNAVKTNVKLAGGDASNFRINADGIAGDQQGLEIFGEDSAYVFVEVTIDPENGIPTPLIITDSVLFETNGNRQKVILAAWGQDAIYFNNAVLSNTNTWQNIKPYVIFNTAVIDSGGSLSIQPGTQIYMGGNAQLIVLGTGKINVQGTKEEPVVFQGVRLEEFYDDLPGQWNGIFILRDSKQNSFDWTIIKNGNYGIHIGYPYPTDSCSDFLGSFSGQNIPSVTLTNTIIQNSFVNNLFAVFAQVDATNCLLFNSGEHVVSLGFGGDYDFLHCTIANYGSPSINHQSATLFLSNILTCGDGAPNTAQMIANFDNTIVYGSLEEEISFDFLDVASVADTFDRCVVKTKRVTDDSLKFVQCIYNLDPQFKDRAEDDYTILNTSPCRDSGKGNSVFFDLNNNPRNQPTPDIGAYEFFE